VSTSTTLQANDTILRTATALGDLTFAVSTYAAPARTNTRPHRQVVTWAALIKTLTTHKRVTDKDDEGWSPATYLEGTTRANKNVDQVSLAVADRDHCTWDDLADLKAHLRELGVAAIIASSYSNQPPDDVRFRVIVPLAAPIPADQAAGRWLQLNEYLFLGKNDPQTKDWSRFFYRTSAPPDVAVFAEVLEGHALDLATLPDVLSTPPVDEAVEPSRGPILPLGRRALLFVAQGAPDGQQRGEALRAARNYLSAGYSREDTAAAIWRGLQASPCGKPEAPWTYADAEQLVWDLAKRPPPPLQPLPEGEDGRRGAGDDLACQAALDQRDAEIAELKAEKRELLAEIADLKRQMPEAFVPRLLRALGELDADPSTRAVAPVVLTLMTERGEAPRDGEAPFICWRGDERSAQLGRSPNTLRKAVDALKEHGIVEDKYKYLGDPADGDWRRERYLRLVPDVPDDLADGLQWVRRRVHEERAPRERGKQKSACEICQTAHCPDHPEAAIEKRVTIHCLECGGDAAPAHVHQPQRPSAATAPAILYPLTPRAPVGSENAKVALTYLVDPKRNNCVLAPDDPDRVEQVLDSAERLATAARAAGLSPVDEVAFKLRALEDLKRAALGAFLPDSEPSPSGNTDCCEVCRQPLIGGDMVVHPRCLAVGVA
jgi:hypothetical protein